MATPTVAAERSRPNIVWFVVDDMSADLSCYRPLPITAPHLDRLAREGTRFTHAYTTAPVCSPSRSAMITGMCQTAIGGRHHRSGRGVPTIQLPEGVGPVPVIFMTDHGISHARAKQFLYDEGTRIPFIVRGPGVPRIAVRDEAAGRSGTQPAARALALIHGEGMLDETCVSGRKSAGNHR